MQSTDYGSTYSSEVQQARYASDAAIPAPPQSAPIYGSQAQNVLLLTQEERARLVQSYRLAVVQAKSGANWFYWIAALSAINTFLFFTHASVYFLAGLSVTDVFNALAAQRAGSNTTMAVVLDLAFIGMFVACGFLAGRKMMTAAFVVGACLYTLDSGVTILLQDWKTLILHALALFFVVRGTLASFKLQKLEPQVRQLRDLQSRAARQV